MASSAIEILAAMEADFRAGEVRVELEQENRKLGEDAADYARTIAPVGGAGDPHPGQFRDSIHVEEHDDVDGMPACSVVSDDPVASYIEFGTKHVAEHGTFADTAVHFNDDASSASASLFKPHIT